MYINKVKINNIRSVNEFEMNFTDDKQAGWHVLIGDNGSGKSTIIKSIALALLGEENGTVLLGYEDFSNWLNKNQPGETSVTVKRDDNYDKPIAGKSLKVATSKITIIPPSNQPVKIEGTLSNSNALWGKSSLSGWFYAAYGPFRRMRGATEVFTHVMLNRPRIGATITAFRDDAALTQMTFWLKDLALDATKSSKKKSDLEQIVQFINNAKLLPNNAILLNDVGSEGIKLKDAWGNHIALMEMSDGYRSVLSMTLDIIRFMMEIYGTEKVFSLSTQGIIELPGVVLIDEVDAHLHPSWQNDIGKWFTKYFPNIQFIVTTHNPIICRACEKGTIWKLPAPGTDEKAREIVGAERDKLIYGNILDQYGTGDFGKEAPRSKDTSVKLDRLAELNNKLAFGKLSDAEKNELDHLRKVLTTDDTTDY